MPFDVNAGWTPEDPKKPKFPPKGMWTPGKNCKNKKNLCNGTAFGEGEACNYCGQFKDGTYD